MMHRFKLLLPGIIAILALAVVTERPEARSFRDILEIPTPSALPENAQRIEPFQRLERELILEGVNEILDAWNSGRLGHVLAEDFVDARKLADTVVTVVPQDARLSMVSMRSYNLLRQYRVTEGDQGDWRVSRVAVTVRLQLTFNDPRTGFQRLPSTSEFILEIREPI